MFSVNIVSSFPLFSRISSPRLVLHSHSVPYSQKMSPNRKRKNSVTKPCLPHSGYSIVPSRHCDTIWRSPSPLPRTLFLEGRTRRPRGGTAEKKETRVNSATLFPHQRPAAALIAILGSSARPSSTFRL